MTDKEYVAKINSLCAEIKALYAEVNELYRQIGVLEVEKDKVIYEFHTKN